MLIKHAGSYREIYDAFRWNVPQRFNIATACCDRWAADPDRVALIHEQPDGQVRRYTFAELRELSNRCANMLVGLGLQRNDRVLLLLGQRPETAILHLAAWRAGMISVLCSVLFGADAVSYRVQTSGAKVVITDDANLDKAIEMAGDARVLCVDGGREGVADFWALLREGAGTFATVDTAADDPAFLLFTSGTTGPAKGALHAHRSLLGHMPCIEMQHDFFPQPGDVVWSPADWAWIAGLMDVLMPSWFHGVPVLAFRSVGFDPEQAFHMIAKHHVTNTLLVPTMIRLMKQVPNPRSRYDLKVRSLISGGEAVGPEIIEWTEDALGIRINEVFGQTECNLVLGHNAALMAPKPGSLGQPIPGHVGAIVDDAGNELPAGEVGQIAFRRPDPVMLLEYWNNPVATRDKFAGDWLLTGDLGVRDEDGYFWYRSRADDVITSAGYRIGPGEIEEALLRHPAVRLAAAIGVPDAVRTESIKAFLVLAEDQQPSDALAQEIREFVKTRLARHEYPRDIEFVDSLPTTTTGKIMRRELRERERAKAASGHQTKSG
ncbi:MAG TPA: AMP-binding protein [Mycobacterium sp.]|nr:AMP-binding protein [Mycobacterium sp.]